LKLLLIYVLSQRTDEALKRIIALGGFHL